MHVVVLATGSFCPWKGVLETNGHKVSLVDEATLREGPERLKASATLRNTFDLLLLDLTGRPFTSSVESLNLAYTLRAPRVVIMSVATDQSLLEHVSAMIGRPLRGEEVYHTCLPHEAFVAESYGSAHAMDLEVMAFGCTDFEVQMPEPITGPEVEGVLKLWPDAAFAGIGTRVPRDSAPVVRWMTEAVKQGVHLPITPGFPFKLSSPAEFRVGDTTLYGVLAHDSLVPGGFVVLEIPDILRVFGYAPTALDNLSDFEHAWSVLGRLLPHLFVQHWAKWMETCFVSTSVS